MFPIANDISVQIERQAAAALMPARRYHAQICDEQELLVLAEDLHAVPGQSAFSSPCWLRPLFETLPIGAGARIIGVVVRRDDDDAIAGVLPLSITREYGCETVRFADFGVTDYASPIFGPAFPASAAEAQTFHDAVRRALSRYDLIRFERLLPIRDGYPHLGAIYPGAVPSRMTGNVVVIGDSVKSYVAALGRKFRKEVERCKRHLNEDGPLVLERAAGDAQLASAFGWLEAMQSQRWSGMERRYRLDQPAYAQFYRDVIKGGVPAGFVDVMTLFSGGVRVGAVFGIRSAGRFTVLRIASDDERWGRFSPGRITLLEAMDCLVGEGVRAFDLGVGNYEFKRRLGAEPFGLLDLVAPLSWKGSAVAAGLRLKAALARQPTFKRLVDRVRGRG